ncbi:A/G-specific adenine glycosylase [Schistosoma bovis]|uniref:Adenine DNA glycosylase n=1 Tax=Schistosoma bovis TaxID=6184 RepID=A0A430QJE9_SCHBO|nr:A/G-specific adenine glycosylase [Schistosoma bovis]
MCSIHSFTTNQIEKLRESLLLWYDRSKRDLPWRRMALNPDPNLRGYAGMFNHSLDFLFHIFCMCLVWVSEVMLQQTQVKTVIDYYDRWMKKWPSVDQLASASLDDVNSLWSGLGYYSRARLLHKGAEKIVNEFNGIFPQSAEVLKRSIPGVGRYTAGAIASIAFNQCTPVLDGNVIRVLTRLRQIGSPVQLPTSMEYLWNLATKLVDPDRPGDFNQALMELGAVCCTPKNPDCMKCPLNKVGLCESYKQANASKSDYISTDLEDCHLCINNFCSFTCVLIYLSLFFYSLGVMNYPVKLSKREPRKQNTVILITHTSRKENEALKNYYLLLQRPKTGLLAGLWEFPSYTIEDDKLTSEIQQSFIPLVIDRITNALNSSLNITSINELNVLHIFSHIHMTYIVFELKVEQQQQQTIPSECLNNSNTTTTTTCDWPPSLNSGRWVSREDLKDSAISTATRKASYVCMFICACMCVLHNL